MRQLIISLTLTAAALLAIHCALAQAQVPYTALQPTQQPITQPMTLQQCIEHAVKNNIAVQQTMLTGSERELQLNTERNSRLPGLDATLGGNSYFGRGPSRDGTYQDNTQLSLSGNISVNVPLFAGFSIRHSIDASTFNLKASLQDIERVREDVSMQITTLYLQVLLNKELLTVAHTQVELSRNKLQKSELLVSGGRSPESQVFESRALLAKDELSLTQCENNLQLSLLDLVQAMNIDQQSNFDILMPRLEDIDLNVLNAMDRPESVYARAVGVRPQILAEQFRLESSRKSLLMAKSALYPHVSIGAGYSTSAYYSYVEEFNNTRFLNQLKNNGSESIGLNISIPIFNKFASRNKIRAARLGIQSQQLSLTESQRKLYKEIEQSYYTAVAAFHKYLSAVKSVDAARIAFSYEQQKADAGRSTIFDFNDAKTRLERSESESVQSKFEFIFRRKILDFYAGGSLDFVAY